MVTARITITFDRRLLRRLDRLVAEKRFPSRRWVIENAANAMIDRERRRRLARECAKLDRRYEQVMAEEGFIRLRKTDQVCSY